MKKNITLFIYPLAILSTALLLFTAGCNSSQPKEKPKQLSVTQHFDPGKTYHLDVERGKISSKMPGMEKMKSVTHVELAVKQSQDSVLECQWIYGETDVTGIDPGYIDDRSKQAMNMHKGLSIGFILNKKGEIVKFTNYPQCKTHIENAFRTIFNMSNSGTTPEQFETMMNALQPTISSPEILLSTYCPEFTAYFMLPGKQLKTDSVYINETELPNPFNNSTFPAEQVIKTDSIDDQTATIIVFQSLDPEVATRILRETFKSMAEQASRPFDENEIPKVDVSQKATYKYDYLHNKMLQFSSEKAIEVSNAKEIQTLRVILKD